MPDSVHQEFTDIIEDVKRYFMQQVDLFGNEIPLNPRGKKPTAKKVEQETQSLFEEVVDPSWCIAPDWAKSQSLDELNKKICECQKCTLGKTRINFVFGVGSPAAKIVFIGEAPGADEDEQGEPFVGRAGQLLNKILAAINFEREEVYIGNILKCRPPNNREPLPTEVEACEPFLVKQLEIMKPKFIIALGRLAAQTLLRTTAGLAELREKVHDYHGVKLMVTYHPAALLRNPQWKRPTWDDVRLFRKLYDEMETRGDSTY